MAGRRPRSSGRTPAMSSSPPPSGRTTSSSASEPGSTTHSRPRALHQGADREWLWLGRRSSTQHSEYAGVGVDNCLEVVVCGHDEHVPPSVTRVDGVDCRVARCRRGRRPPARTAGRRRDPLDDAVDLRRRSRSGRRRSLARRAAASSGLAVRLGAVRRGASRRRRRASASRSGSSVRWSLERASCEQARRRRAVGRCSSWSSGCRRRAGTGSSRARRHRPSSAPVSGSTWMIRKRLARDPAKASGSACSRRSTPAPPSAASMNRTRPRSSSSGSSSLVSSESSSWNVASMPRSRAYCSVWLRSSRRPVRASAARRCCGGPRRRG